MQKIYFVPFKYVGLECLNNMLDGIASCGDNFFRLCTDRIRFVGFLGKI